VSLQQKNTLGFQRRLTTWSLSLPVVVADPDLAKHILISKNFSKSFTYKTFEPIFGDESLLVLPDKQWFEKRRAFNPGFTPVFLKNVVEVLADKLERLLEGINQDVKAKRETDMLTRSQTFTVSKCCQISCACGT